MAQGKRSRAATRTNMNTQVHNTTAKQNQLEFLNIFFIYNFITKESRRSNTCTEK